MAKEFRIYTRVWDEEAKDHHYAAVKVSGTAIGYELFAYKEQGRALYPELRWKIVDIKSGTAIPMIACPIKGALLRFASLADCKDWVLNMPTVYKDKIDETRASPKYQQLCQDFANLPQE